MTIGGFSAFRDIGRLHEITAVLIKHGLGDLVHRVGIGGVLERAGRILHWGQASESSHLAPPARARQALEELGPTFIKLGQILSTREDIFDPEWTAEFERLQSDVGSVPIEALVPVMEAALGASPYTVFEELDNEPLATGSIAQVHRARLTNGAEVVLKVRRPGIERTIEADLRILGHIAALLESEVPEARRYQPTQILAQFSRTLRRELDLALEGRNIERFAKNFADEPTLLIPKVYWEWTTPLMNVQEYIDGIPGRDVEAIDRAGLDRKVLAARGANNVLKMILVHGFFHADPHPGNVFYLPGDRIAMVDFGMVGRLRNARRAQIVDLFAGFAQRDEQAVLEVLLEWTGDAPVDEARLAGDLDDLVFDLADIPLREIRMSSVIEQVTSVVRQHSIVLPPDLSLMFKALITLEGLGRRFDPDFRLVEHLAPLIEEAKMERYRPAALARQGQQGLSDLLGMVGNVPRELARLVKDARRGRMRIDLDLKRLDSFGERLDHTIDRITIGIMTASLVIGSSIVMTVAGGPELFGMPLLTVLGLLGYLVAFVNSVWIVFSIWRDSRR